MLEINILLKKEFQKDKTHKVFENVLLTYWSMESRNDIFRTTGKTNLAAGPQIYPLTVISSPQTSKNNSLASSATKKHEY